MIQFNAKFSIISSGKTVEQQMEKKNHKTFTETMSFLENSGGVESWMQGVNQLVPNT